MSIKKKVFFTLFAMIATVLLLSYLVIYGLFYHTLVSKIKANQSSVITLNQHLIENFVESMYHTTTLLVGDEAIGKYLSEELPDTMAKIRVRRGIQQQFSHYLSLQSSFYQNTLFLNSDLPISGVFTSETLDSSLPWRSSNIYSNEKVALQDWYQKTLTTPTKAYLFVNDATNELCYAKMIQNNYYTGLYHPSGLGVVVIQIPCNKLDKILSMTPITPNSGFVLIRDDFDVLYQNEGSTKMPQDLLPLLQEKKSDRGTLSPFRDTLTLDGRQYITYYQTMDNGLSFVFYTPYSDITDQVAQITSIYISFGLSFVLLASLLAYAISRRIIRPLIQFSGAISSIDDTRDFDLDTLRVSKDLEMEILRESFEKLIFRINTLIRDIRLHEERQTEYRLRTLQAQINPHFMYNAMDTVNWIALSKNEDEIANIVSSISNLMRYSITEPDKMVSLSQELQNIQEYIAIQQVRYENRIDLVIAPGSCSPGEIFIPKFTVQPLVENSILHGNDSPDTEIQITVTIRRSSDHTFIEICDNGRGCDPELLNRYLAHGDRAALCVSGGFGIRNVNERLHLTLGAHSGLRYTVNSAGQLTAILTLD